MKTVIQFMFLITLSGEVISRYTPVENENEVELEVRETNMERDGRLFPTKFQANFDFTGKTVSMDLERNDEVGLDFPVIFLGEGDSVSIPSKPLTRKDKFAFYRDRKRGIALAATKIDGLNDSYVLDGMFTFDGETYEIKPGSDNRNPSMRKTADFGRKSSPMSHSVKRMGKATVNIDAPVFPPIWTAQDGNDTSWGQDKERESARAKRQTTTNTIDDYHIEIDMLVDHTVWDFWQTRSIDDEDTTENIAKYVAHYVNGMSIPYSNIDISEWRMRISLSVKNLFISKELSTSPWTTGNSVTSASGSVDPLQTSVDGLIVLDKLGAWSTADGRSWNNPDHTMLLTRYDLDGPGTVGKAYVGTVCVPGLSVSVIQDIGLNNYFIAAHELGHGLGSLHDGGDANSCNGEDYYIMAAVLGEVDEEKLDNVWFFSECSIRTIKAVLGGVEGFQFPRVCLTDRSCEGAGLPDFDLTPGLTTSLNQQCEYKYGGGSEVCISLLNIADLCRIIYCTSPYTPGSNGRCYTISPGAIDGTPCGVGLSCFRGYCVDTSAVVDTTSGDDTCVEKSLSKPVPDGCTDNPNYFIQIRRADGSSVSADCDTIVRDFPYVCFSAASAVTQCCATCTRWGLVDPQMPVEGAWNAWGAWSSCSVTCGDGIQQRNRDCLPQDSICIGGESSERRPCTGTSCGADGGWSDWSQWSPCSLTCGTGSQSRTRSCTNPPPSGEGGDCNGSDNESRNCNTLTCPIDGGWSAWGSWSSCSQSCGSGTQFRSRTCSNPTPSASGLDCSGSGREDRSCSNQDCPTNGAWSLWGQWSLCSRTCGPGSQTRRRSCSNPAPANGGSDCVGSSSQNLNCNEGTCPTNGVWSSWGSWSQCSVSCGSGSQSRARVCTNPPPSNGGNECVGSSTDSLPCTGTNCPVDGGWTSWASWSQCSSTCGAGTQSRVRSCTNPVPANGGDRCVGESTAVRNCNANCTASVDGGWGLWGPWSECSATCGRGYRSRARTCDNPTPTNGGRTCSGYNQQFLRCQLRPCSPGGSCVDRSAYCWYYRIYCTSSRMETTMRRYCPRTCGYCATN